MLLCFDRKDKEVCWDSTKPNSEKSSESIDKPIIIERKKIDKPIKIKRKKTNLTCADYNVAWICALSDSELLAARLLLDEEYMPPSYEKKYDRNTYIYGRIGGHRVVVGCLPSGRPGNINSCKFAGSMFHTFPNIRTTLLVGIAGGVPLDSPEHPKEDMYLGDVVVGWPGDGTSAVIQYDSGRWLSDGVFEQRGLVDQPDWHVTQALAIMMSNHQLGQLEFGEHLARLKRCPKFASPRSDEDKLYTASYEHMGNHGDICTKCHPSQLVVRPNRAEARPEGSLFIHESTIASGEAIICDGVRRDQLSQDCNGARCFEMEAVGVSVVTRCLVIRGIANYADSHKNDVWKYTAAGNAAMFAKEFLLLINPPPWPDLKTVARRRLRDLFSFARKCFERKQAKIAF